jgi:hypothetical protein
MSRAIRVLVTTACLLTVASCASFYLSSQQEPELTLWSDVPVELKFWDWLGIILLVLSGALGYAALRLYSEDKVSRMAKSSGSEKLE